MTKTSPTEENPSPLAKSDEEEEEKSRSDDSKPESCSGRSSLLVSNFQLKPVTKSTGRKSGVAVLSPKVSHFTKQAVGSESLRQRMRTEHNERYFTVTRKYPAEEGEFSEPEIEMKLMTDMEVLEIVSEFVYDGKTVIEKEKNDQIVNIGWLEEMSKRQECQVSC